MTEKTVILDEQAMARAIARISYEIIEKNHGAEDICIVGIYTRGAQLARRIAAKIKEVEGRTVDIGFLDITPSRDDRRGEDAKEDHTQLNFSIEGRTVILVDDVLYTGRSARAAMDALLKRGRPQKIQLAVLIDRGHRELPIRPDFIGKNLPTSRDEMVRVMVSEIDGLDKIAIFTGKENENGTTAH